MKLRAAQQVESLPVDPGQRTRFQDQETAGALVIPRMRRSGRTVLHTWRLSLECDTGSTTITLACTVKSNAEVFGFLGQELTYF